MMLASDVTISGGVLLNRNQILDEAIIDLAVSCGIKTINIVEEHAAAQQQPLTGAETSEQRPMDPSASTEPAANVSRALPPEVSPLTELPPATQEASKPIQPDSSVTFSTNVASNDAKPPLFNVRITPDAMSATLIIEPPPEGTPAEINSAMILTTLTEKEIVHGIDTAAIDRLVEAWAKLKRRYEVSNIAVGTEARPARDGAFQMKGRHISSRREYDETKTVDSYWMLAEINPHLDRASKSDPIAEKLTGQLAPPGKDILGAPVFSDEVIQCEITLEENVSLSIDGTAIVADCDGIAYLIDDKIGVIPLNFDGCFECSVAADGMSAEVTVHPPGPGGTMPEKSVLRCQLSEKKVTFGVQEQEIDTLLALCENGTYPDEPVIVARGIPPEHGENGKIIYHFNTTTSLAPAISDAGQADYKSLNIVNSVSAGQQLASLQPPGKGIDGTDIFGKNCPAKPGIPARLPQGPHTKADPENPDVLLAETDGIVRLSGTAVEVCEGFVVPGNVDFSTGNIEYNKTVIVSGDVKAGFTIHCGADLQVNGTIEDCQVSVGGNVLCRYGFLGQGKGVIDAKGDVNLGFLKNQTVRCFKNITIAKEAINATLLSRGCIAVHGSPLSVAGGELKARTSITVHTAGNHTGIKTLLEVGTDFLMAEELAMLGKQEKEVAAHIRSISEVYSRFRKFLDSKRRLTAAQQKKNGEFTAALHQAQQQLSVLENRKEIVAGKLHQLDGVFIRIEHTAYPGTLLKFGDRHFLIKEELTGPKNFRYIDHEIKVL